MKTWTFLLFLILSVTSATSQTVASKASDVTVYLHGAQVTRYADVNLKAGRNELIITGVSPSADVNTLQVMAQRGLAILEVKPKPSHERAIEQQKKSDELKDSIVIISRDIELLRVDYEALGHEENFLMTNSRIKGTTTLSADEFKASNSFYSNQMKEVLRKKYAIAERIEKLKERLSVIQNLITKNLTQSIKADLHLHVTVQVNSAQKSKLRISYFVRDAGWRPSYDLRVKDVQSPMEIVYKAQLYQETKEDWNDVTMTFSNANPVKSGNLPKLNPYYLRYNARYVDPRKAVSAQSYLGIDQRSVNGRVTDEYGKGVPYARITAYGTTMSTFSDEDGYFIIQVPNSVRTLTVSATGYSARNETIYGAFLQVFLSRIKENTTAMTNRLDKRYESLARVDDKAIASMKVKEDVRYYADGISTKNALGSVNITRGKAKALANMSVNKRSRVQADSYSWNMGDGGYSTSATNTSLEVNQTTVTYTLQEPFSLASGEAPKTVNLVAKEVAASYEYRTIPKLEEAAFLIAQLTDWSKLNLLEGEANIYFENAFTGKSVLDVRFLKDTLDISLGRDENVVVKREKVKTFSRNQVVGKNTISKRKFTVSARNGKSQPINMVVYDQVPVSTIKDITVQNTSFDGAGHDEDSGKLTWKTTLEPGKSQTFTIKYEVKYDKGRFINLE